MSVIVVGTAFPFPEHRAEVVAAMEAAIARGYSEQPWIEMYALHEGTDRLVMIEKHAADGPFAEYGASPALGDLKKCLRGKLKSDLDLQVFDLRALVPHPSPVPDAGGKNDH